jgi:type 1 fimbria pilin
MIVLWESYPVKNHMRIAGIARSVMVLIALAFLTFAATSAHAASCRFSGSALQPLDFGIVTTPSNAPAGTVIATREVTLDWDCPPFDQKNDRDSAFSIGFQNRNPDNILPSGYFPTKFPDLMISVRVDGKIVTRNDMLITNVYTGRPYSESNTLTLTLAKRTSKKLPIGRLLITSDELNLVSTDLSSGESTSGGSLGQMRATVTSSTCSTNNVTVTLPAITAKALALPGRAAGETPLTIKLSCPSAMPSRMFLILDGNRTSDNLGSDLSLTPDSTAAGVVVRISRAAGSESQGRWQFDVMPASTGTVEVPLTASYVATGPVTPGIVKAIATFSLNYE